MPIDKPKRPNHYQAAFHNVLKHCWQRALADPQGVETDWLVCQNFPDQVSALREARRFRAFVKSLRMYPLHPLARILQSHTPRTRVREGFFGGWQLQIQLQKTAGTVEDQLTDAINQVLAENS